MNEAVNEAELGRSKKSSSPGEHLVHLLNLGWTPASLLIQKYVAKHGLHNQLAEWQKNKGTVIERAEKAK